MPAGWYGVDLDGTLARYSSWYDSLEIGEPVPKMVERVKELLSSGKTVKIFTARMSEPDFETRDKIREAIGDWCEKHLGQRLAVTNVKDYGMVELWDDRCRQVVHNTGAFIDDLKEEYRFEAEGVYQK